MADRRPTGRYVIPQKRHSARSTTADERSINVRDVQANGDKVVLPSGVKVVASYSWSSTSREGSPRIIVPGAGPVFVSPRGRRFSLPKQFDDPWAGWSGNRMHPFNPLEPVFHSLKECSPELDTGTINIITGRNNLRKLLKFCGSPGESSRSSSSYDDPMKFFVHGIGEDCKGRPSLVFSKDPSIKGSFQPGYGYNFEKELTEKDPRAPPDLQDFHVIVKMNLDGISILVRAEVDACETIPTRVTSSGGSRVTKDELSEKVGSLLISSEEKNEAATSGFSGDTASRIGRYRFSRSGLTSTKSGVLLGDETQMLELKTRSSRYAHEIPWRNIYWQMALGGAHKLVLGVHERGQFDGVQELPIAEVKAHADRTGSTSMVYLANTLREVVKEAHCLMAETPSSRSGRCNKGVRAVVVVEHSPHKDEGLAPLRVRLAVPTDGAVAP